MLQNEVLSKAIQLFGLLFKRVQKRRKWHFLFWKEIPNCPATLLPSHKITTTFLFQSNCTLCKVLIQIHDMHH